MALPWRGDHQPEVQICTLLCPGLERGALELLALSSAQTYGELSTARVLKVPGSKLRLPLLFPLSVLTWNVRPSSFAPPPTTKTPPCLLTWETLCSSETESFWVLAKCPLVSELHFLSISSLLPASTPLCSVRPAYCTPPTVADIILSRF